MCCALKKICYIIAALLVFGSVSVFGEDAPVTASYKTGFSSEQGKDYWYYCYFVGNEANEMQWNGTQYVSNSGTSLPNIKSSDLSPGSTMGSGYKFIAPEKGMVRLAGTVSQAYPESANGNGIKAHIFKGKNELWSAVVTYGNPQSYDLTIPIREGEELYFYGDSNGKADSDWFWWRPTVDYLGIDYVAEAEDSLYFQKSGDEMVQLEFNNDTESYHASDGIAFINREKFMPSEEYTLVKRYTAESDTRYRVHGTIKPLDARNGGTVLTVKKDGEKVWEQLFPDDKQGSFDVRMRANAGENIDVELSTAEYTGYNYSEWECYIEPFPGTAACTASTSVNPSYAVLSEFSLSSLTGRSSEDGVKFYSQRFSRKIPMTYDSANQKWVSGIDKDPGYFTAKAACPGKHYDSVMEYTVTKDGILKIDGDLAPGAASDGVVSKIFLNDEVIWSSRVGGERPVRWDEPYDISYFSYNVNAVMKVKAGDTLKFSFNQWRLVSNDAVDLSNVMLRYISGDVLSETTKWKLDKSIVVDTLQKTVRKDGITESADVFVDNGTTYMAVADAERIFGAEAFDSEQKKSANGIEYIPLRTAAEEAGKSVVWAADRLVLIHDGIPVLFGWPELSEIDVALEGGALFE